MPLLLLLVFAFCYAAFCATRGIDLDQMILYQAALKLLDGQTLYQDFFIPHGPLGTLILTPFLRFFSTSGMGVVVASGLLNLAATFSIWLIVKKHTRENHYPLLAGCLTATWFLPVFGMYYYDHLAYLFVLLAFVLYTARDSKVLAVFSAVCLVFSFHTKQTVGAPAFCALLLSYFLTYGKSDLLSRKNRVFILSFCLGHLFIFSLIALFSDFSNYWECTFQLPIAFSLASEEKGLGNIFYTLLFPFKINPLQMLTSKGMGRLLFYPVVLAMYYSYWASIKTQKNREERFALLFLIFSTLFCSALLGRLFAHVYFGMGGIIMLSLSQLEKEKKVVHTVTLFFIVLGISYTHYLRPFNLKGDSFFRNTDLSPIQIRTSSFAKSSEKMISYIQQNPGTVVSLADTAYLVPLALKQATLNPTVYYHDGLTVPLQFSERTRWEKSNITVMEANKIKYVLMTSPIEIGFRPISSKTLQVVPVSLLDSYVKTNYHPVITEPQFQLWQRN